MKKNSYGCLVLISLCLLSLPALGDEVREDDSVAADQRLADLHVAILESPDNFGGFELEMVRAFLRSSVGDSRAIQVQLSWSPDPRVLGKRMFAGEYDVLGSRWVETEERKQFCFVPYLPSSLALVAAAESDIRSLDEVSGRTLCTLEGSTYSSMIPNPEEVEIVVAEGGLDFFQKFKSGVCEALLIDTPMALISLEKLPGSRVVTFVSTGHFLSLAFKERDLCLDFASFVVRYMDSGSYAALVRRMFQKNADVYLGLQHPESDLQVEDAVTTEALLRQRLLRLVSE